MEFRTPQPPLKGRQGLVSHASPVVMLGSCFTDNVGARLSAEGFDALVNPCGTLYNPASIAQTLLEVLYERPYTEADLFEHDGAWHSHMHHSRFSGPDPAAVAAAINAAHAATAQALARADVLIVTFGTAYIYRLADDGRVVANCHKLPASTFRRERLQPQQIFGLWKKILRELTARRPDMKVIFTVSPIRHRADGLHANTVSKATLHLAVERLTEEMPQTAIYFPAYEIMMDDLRDYRFYASDMIHPSEVAIDYIYDIFRQSFMDAATITRADEALRQHRRSLHRPII